MFEKLFNKMNTVDFYVWIKQLVDNNNQYIEDYDSDYIGWYLECTDLLQINEVGGCLVFRINPEYYKDFCIYFKKNIEEIM